MAATHSSFTPRDAALLVVLALVWGNSFLFIKTAVAHVAPAWVVAIRMTLGAALLIGIAAVQRKAPPRGFNIIFKLGLIGIFGSALPWFSQAWAQRSLDSGLVSVLNATTPVATLLLAVLLRQEHLYANRLLGLSIAIGGVLLIVGGEIHAGRSPLALLMSLLSTIGYALASVLTRAHVSGRITNVWAAAIQLAWGAALLGPLTFLIQGPPPPPSALPPAVLGALLLLGLFGTGLAFLMYFSLIERVGATNTSMVTYLVPIVGLVSGALVRGERFGGNVLLGALLMLGGVWLSQRAPATRSSRLGA
jgi:drug/metabolite transporter (DMT)-like permease